MSYYLARSLRALIAEINAEMSPPEWPTVSVGDGWVGDTSHAARKSDHNPDWDSGGVVRAVDIGIEGRNAGDILDAVIGDQRVWYVIHKGRIWSRTYGWANRSYTGSNPHNHHIHVSIRHTDAAENDTSQWLEGEAEEEVAININALANKVANKVADKILSGIAEAVWGADMYPGDPKKTLRARAAMRRAAFSLTATRNHGSRTRKLIRDRYRLTDEQLDDVLVLIAEAIEEDEETPSKK